MPESHVARPLPRKLRAVKLIRVSKRGKRTADKFVSPEDQDRLMDELCAREGFIPVGPALREINQSGLRTPFEKRKGLYPATQMIENGEADVVVMAFRDRMARNIVVEGTFQGRVGKAGGRIWAADSGEIKLDTAVERFQSGVLGLMAQMQAEQTAEKTAGPKQRAINMGIAPYPVIPIGYRRFCDLPENEGSTDRHIVVYEPERALVVRAYEMREGGASLESIRDWLRSQGIDIQIRGVQELLKKRTYLGELKFGKLTNPRSHEPIIGKRLFDAVQNMRVPRGPRTGDFSSTRLLARQGIVRCGYCGHAMTVGSQTKKDGTKYYDYRCPSMGDCSNRVAISADVLEREVVAYMKTLSATGRASIDNRMAEAEAAVEQTNKKLRRYLAIVGDENDDIEEAKTKIAELRAAHDAAKDQLHDLRSALGSTLTLTLADWDAATLAEQRRWLRIVFDRIEISKGRGADRIKAFRK